MPFRFFARVGPLSALIVSLAACSTCRASFHLWHTVQFFSNASGSVQFIEMHDDFTGENFVEAFPLSSNTHTFSFPENLPGDTMDKSVTLGTASLKAYGFKPDYEIPPNFFNPAGDSINWAFDTNIFTFGPGQVPTDGVHSLAEDFSVQPAHPTNYKDESIDLVIPAPGDADHDGRITVDDYAAIDQGFANHLAGFARGDFDADGDIDADDYRLIDEAFVAQLGPPAIAAAAVPEPAAGLVAVATLAGLLARRRVPCR
jgi:hypothetical protein